MAEAVKIITEFDAMLDKDLAVMKLLQKKYNDPSYVNQDIMRIPITELKKKLCERENECPFSICIEDKEKSVGLYRKILEEEHDEILKILTPTGIFELMEVYNKYDGYEVTVICKDEDEKAFIQYADPSFNVIVETEWKNIDSDIYDVFFLKSILHIFKFEKKFEKKHFFIMKYMFNLTKDPNDGTLYPNSMIGTMLVPLNRIGLVEIYSRK